MTMSSIRKLPRTFALALICGVLAGTAGAQIIITVAGTGSLGYSGDGGPAASAQLDLPRGVAVDASGNLYIADTNNNRVRKVSSTSGIITTVAGNGICANTALGCYSGDGGPATSAGLNSPGGVAVDANGDLYIADADDCRVLKVSAGGIITTVAGSGWCGYSGDGGPAASAMLWQPLGVAVDATGSLYIADAYNSRVRKVSPAGIITTVAGTGGCWISPIYCYSGDGGPATSAELSYPLGVAVDVTGNLYIADAMNGRVRKVSAGGIITTVAGGCSCSSPGDGGPATSAFVSPWGVAVDASGNLYIADAGNGRVRKVSPAGIITTVAGDDGLGYPGDGGLATSAELNEPSGVAVDARGDLYIADALDNRVRLVTASGHALRRAPRP
jgi:sugar lactone lactonase YvrE